MDTDSLNRFLRAGRSLGYRTPLRATRYRRAMPEMTDRIRQYLLTAQTLVYQAEVALGHQERGDVQRACDAISHSADALSHVGKEWKAILDAFGEDGVYPGQREA